jgi:hypothetical protein
MPEAEQLTGMHRHVRQAMRARQPLQALAHRSRDTSRAEARTAIAGRSMRTGTQRHAGVAAVKNVIRPV